MAQDPLLLETIEQEFDNVQNQWVDQSKITYSYDQHGRMIQQARYNLQLCDINDPECEYRTDPKFSREESQWQYTSNGLETFFGENRYGITRNTNGVLVEIRTRRFSRQTDYNEDSLIVGTVEKEQYQYSLDDIPNLYTKTDRFEYDSDKRMTFREYHDRNENGDDVGGWISQDYRQYDGSKIISDLSINKSYYQEDTTDIFRTNTTFSYNNSGQLLIKTIDHSSESYGFSNQYMERELYSYNQQGWNDMIRTEWFDDNSGEWNEYHSKTIEHYPNGSRKTEISVSKYQNVSGLVTDTLRVQTSQFDEQGRNVEFVTALHAEDGTFIKELSSSRYEWVSEESYHYTSRTQKDYTNYSLIRDYDSEGRLLQNYFQFSYFDQDSILLRNTINGTSYEYDTQGSLIRSTETRRGYDGDSLLLTACCGSFYEIVSTYDNRCDGAAEKVNREQWTYITGTSGEFEPQTRQTRQLNTHTMALCDFSESPELNVHMYPNPSSYYIDIESTLLQSPGTSFEIIDAHGKIVQSDEAPITRSIRVHLDVFPSGMYIVKLSNGNDQAAARLVKQ